MDQTNQQAVTGGNVNSSPPTVQAPNQSPTTGGVTSDYLVTQRIDTSQIPKSQIKKDLEMFTKAEEKMYSSTPEAKKIVSRKNLHSLPKIPPTEVDVLRIKNPFRGE